MLCALCSVAPELGITKGRRQNIVCGHTSSIFSYQIVKRVQQPKAGCSALASRFYRLTVPKGSAQCFVVSTCTEPKSMQNFPNNIVLTSHSCLKYYTMCRCLSTSCIF